MLPALQKEETTWPELRSMGVGWWLRSTNKLRRCIEKVRQPISLSQFAYSKTRGVREREAASIWSLYLC